ncbi:peroxisomal membrane protein PEX16-like protein [Dinothrombium tinctorium]|uniref:Peroxisomal membrane protein PEX16 n=1 Tax=Dinothrombium tinctorium TaxID=1965070 RepID=A0A443QL44_9ACAR|nr:peroxisomal membrane protein PEX16-like protein [Dinothrombium tinctorium]
MSLESLKESVVKYKTFVEMNPMVAKEVETLLRWISYLMSGRVDNSHIVSELIYSASNLLQLLNDYILRKAAGIEFTLNSTPEVEHLQIFLTVVEYIQVFSEFLAKRFSGEFGKWITIAIIQTTKAVIKLVLLFKYDRGIQCQLPIIPLERRTDLPLSKNCATPKCSSKDEVDEVNNSSTLKLKRSGRVMRSLETAPPRSKRTWMLPIDPKRDLVERQRKNAPPTPLNDVQKMGELLHIVRPVAHVFAMGGFGEQAWTPYLLSLGMDVASLHLLTSTNKPWNSKEKIEIGQRSIALLFYLLRSPFFDKYTKIKLLKILRLLADNIPLFGRLIRPFINYLPEWQKTYFYVWVM